MQTSVVSWSLKQGIVEEKTTTKLFYPESLKSNRRFAGTILCTMGKQTTAFDWQTLIIVWITLVISSNNYQKHTSFEHVNSM